MKKAKLKKLMLQAKDTRRKRSEAVDHLTAEILVARNNFARTKEQLKGARKHCKEARKYFRKLEKALKIGQSDRERATETFAKLEKKWRKLNSNSRKVTPPRRKKTASKKPQKPGDKVSPRRDDIVSA